MLRKIWTVYDTKNFLGKDILKSKSGNWIPLWLQGSS